jgi:hypothetical protein
MHSRVEILLRHGVVSAIKQKRIDPTIRIDRFGKVECKNRASTDTMRISKVQQVASHHLRFSLSGAGANPCSPPGITPDIDYTLAVGVFLTSSGRLATINVAGGVDLFPSFEMYASVNNDAKNVITLFRLPASESPFDLRKGAVRKVKVSRRVVARSPSEMRELSLV